MWDRFFERMDFPRLLPFEHFICIKPITVDEKGNICGMEHSNINISPLVRECYTDQHNAHVLEVFKLTIA